MDTGPCYLGQASCFCQSYVSSQLKGHTWGRLMVLQRFCNVLDMYIYNDLHHNVPWTRHDRGSLACATRSGSRSRWSRGRRSWFSYPLTLGPPRGRRSNRLRFGRRARAGRHSGFPLPGRGRSCWCSSWLRDRDGRGGIVRRREGLPGCRSSSSGRHE
jgi:hypothetical protein